MITVNNTVYRSLLYSIVSNSLSYSLTCETKVGIMNESVITNFYLIFYFATTNDQKYITYRITRYNYVCYLLLEYTYLKLGELNH